MEREKNNICFDNYNDFEVVTGTCKHSFPVHIHKSLCVGMITKGKALFVCGNNNSVLEEGSLYIISPYSPHTIAPIDGMTYSYLTVCFKNNIYSKSDLSEYIALAVSFIENSNIPVLSVQDISELINMSKYHFIRMFKNKVGITPYQFILNNKIKKIRQGILSKQSLSDLALDLGFSDQSHLCNTFKKYVGISPLQFSTAFQSH